MSKTLILSDIHLKHVIAEKIISSVKPDKTVMLADYFDDFGDNYDQTCATAEWLAWSVNQPNRIHLLGNHDVMYMFPNNRNIRCAGYEDGKSVAINDFVKPEHWNKLQFFAVLDDWFLTHGGIHPYWIDKIKYNDGEEVQITKSVLIEKLKNDSIECKKHLTMGKHHWFEMSGWSRGYSPFVGGILWCDFNHEFQPIRGIHQIVGHTPDRDYVRWKFLKENDTIVSESTMGAEPVLSNKSSYNVCFDSYPALKWYAVWEEKKLNIYETKNL